MKLLIVLAILFALLWQVRVPLVRFACDEQWLSTEACSALLPTELTGKATSDIP